VADLRYRHSEGNIEDVVCSRCDQSRLETSDPPCSTVGRAVIFPHNYLAEGVLQSVVLELTWYASYD
jgi:hypothetical protein